MTATTLTNWLMLAAGLAHLWRLSGGLWIAAFFGFAAVYAAILFAPRSTAVSA